MHFMAPHLCPEKDFVVRDKFLPRVSPDMKTFAFKFVVVTSVDYQDLTEVQESRDYNSSVNPELGGFC